MDNRRGMKEFLRSSRLIFPTSHRLRSIGLNPFTLTFSGEYEAAYRENFFLKSLPQIRLAIILGFLLYSVFGLLDAVLIPEKKHMFWLLRYAVVDPALVAVFFLSFSSRYRAFFQLTMTGLMILGGLVIIAMVVLAGPPASFSYYAGLILIFIWGYTFIRVRFIFATAAAWFLVLIYELAAVATATPWPILVNNNFFFISANIIGMFTCYSIEYYGRRDFYLQRRLEEEKEKVHAANRDLEQKVQERTLELQVKNENLHREIEEREKAEREKRLLEERLASAEKMEAIGRLAGGVAHDLNNVLNAIVAYPDLILLLLPKDSPTRKHVLTMQQSGLKAAAIVRDLLTLARRGVTVKEVTNINDIVAEYLNSPECEKLGFHHPKVKITADLLPDLWCVEGSPHHIRNSLMNLVSNAAEAIDGQGEVVITTLNRTVSGLRKGADTLLADGDYVLLEVADNGLGLSAEDCKKIFEPFYTKKAMGRSGTGLGMSVVWGTVEDHHGKIDVQSIEGQGTTISLSIPRTLKLPGKEQESISELEFMGNAESILVVDDIAGQREIARDLLQKLGYLVETAESGEMAVEHLKSHPVDLVILDMIMDPGIDGLDTYRRILEAQPRTRAIIASGFSETDRVRETIRLGAGAYIMKPYTLRKIGAAVRAELGRPRDS